MGAVAATADRQVQRKRRTLLPFLPIALTITHTARLPLSTSTNPIPTSRVAHHTQKPLLPVRPVVYQILPSHPHLKRHFATDLSITAPAIYTSIVMPALSYKHDLEKRDGDSGRNFSIIFAVIAFVIVAGCLFWGIFLPKYRKKHPHPSPTRYNGLNQPQAFPSHPALLRGFRNRPSSRLRKYNPRTQTPFPNTPPPGDTISIPSLTPCSRSAQDISLPGFGDGVFSPARDRLPSRRGLQANDNPSHGSLLPNLTTDDYILPVPEPMALCPRSAGKAPTLARQLKRFPMPRFDSAETGKLAHPRKLFNDLEQRYSKTTTITSFETPSPMPLNTEHQNELARKHPKCTKPLSFPEPSSGPSSSQAGPPNDASMDDQSGTTNSSTSESDKKSKVTRAGTTTRPKTPVAEIRDLYDRQTKDTVTRAASSPKSATVSSIDVPTASTFSSYIRSGTPPTSPIEGSKRNECSTRLARDGPRPAFISPTSHKVYDRNTVSSVALPMVDRLTPMDTIPEGNKGDSRIGRRLKTNRTLVRPRPARLNLHFNAKSPFVKKTAQRHSMSSLSSLLMPLGRSKRPSVQASSVYSRDTRGVSIVRSPTSPAFSEHPVADAEREAGTMARKASSLDLLRSKIDNWDLHTAYLDFPTSPSSTLKRALSDLGPRSPTFPAPRPASVGTAGERTDQQELQRPIPRICVGRPSDDIFRDPSPNIESGRVLKRVLDMEVAASIANLTRSLSKGSAPGGADWI